MYIHTYIHICAYMIHRNAQELMLLYVMYDADAKVSADDLQCMTIESD